MDKIQVVFSVTNDDGPQYKDPLTFTDTTPEFKNITFSQGGDVSTYEIKVDKNIGPTFPKELPSILNEARSEAERFIYVFSVAAYEKFYGLTFTGYWYSGQFHSITGFVKGSTMFAVTGPGARLSKILTSNSKEINQIKKRMKLGYDLPKLQRFFDAATISEPIGRFISLYTLMLHESAENIRDNQKKVDEAILSVDPTVASYKSPISNRYETVFTKLRNELSHKRDGVNMIRTHDEIRVNVERFERIVRAFIIGS
jgi:hypothetical protein